MCDDELLRLPYMGSGDSNSSNRAPTLTQESCCTFRVGLPSSNKAPWNTWLTETMNHCSLFNMMSLIVRTRVPISRKSRAVHVSCSLLCQQTRSLMQQQDLHSRCL
ncbi:hypothetical protein LEMLEM_LOCUS13217 [Lemmus lemmus]